MEIVKWNYWCVLLLCKNCHYCEEQKGEINICWLNDYSYLFYISFKRQSQGLNMIFGPYYVVYPQYFKCTWYIYTPIANKLNMIHKYSDLKLYISSIMNDKRWYIWDAFSNQSSCINGSLSINYDSWQYTNQEMYLFISNSIKSMFR